MERPALLDQVTDICRRAGDAVLDVYGSEFTVDVKEDRSPLTEADRRAHRIIVTALAELTPGWPVLSEESPRADFDARQGWTTYWLVDPLDGTKEFIKRNGEFTINVALIEQRRPTLGAVRAPALGVDYFGALTLGAWRQPDGGAREAIRASANASSPVRVVGSRSHRGASLDKLLARVGDYTMVPMGSSLKICLVAAGDADLYPRLGPTSEWDTAAAHAVLESAGGYLVDLNGQRLDYNKGDILNPYFLAFGDETRDWLSLIKD